MNHIEGKIGIFSIILGAAAMFGVTEIYYWLVPGPWDVFTVFYAYPFMLISGVLTYHVSDQTLRRLHSLLDKDTKPVDHSVYRSVLRIPEMFQ